MTLTESVVLQLVAHAINVDYDLDLALFKDVNWKQVYQIAKGQGVAGVALDAIEALPLNSLDRLCMLNGKSLFVS